MAHQGKAVQVGVEYLRLDLQNFRHDPMRTQEDALAYLVLREKVIELALDIAEEGPNPLERLGLLELKGSGNPPSYTALEGNRRVCALMLLHDPEKLPAGHPKRRSVVKRLEQAAARANLPAVLDCVVFPSKRAAKPWIDRLHLGESDGRSRKRWRSDQIERAMASGGRNKDAMAVLDVAQGAGLIDQADRDRKLTTVQRYVGNPVMRQVMGLERDETSTYRVNRPRADFQVLFNQFIDDVRSGALSSRSNKESVELYASSLPAKAGVGDERIDPYLMVEAYDAAAGDGGSSEGTGDEPIDQAGGAEPEGPKPKPVRTKIGINSDVEVALDATGSEKLRALYRSCADLALKHHTPLITVGIWSLLESLATLHKGSEAHFHDYFSKDFLRNLGFEEKRARDDMWDALQRISKSGNATKHSAIAASFDGRQVANDMDVLVNLLLRISVRIAERAASPK